MKLDWKQNALSRRGHTEVTAVIAASVMLLATVSAQTAKGCDDEEEAGKAKVAVSAAPATVIHVSPDIVTVPSAKVRVKTAPAIVATPALAADLPVIASSPRIAALPAPPTAPVRVGYSEGSIEERLERVERLLERLMRDKPGYGLYTPAPAMPMPPKGPWPGADNIKPDAAPWPKPGKGEWDVFQRGAEAHAKAAEKHAQAMAKQAEQQSKTMAKQAEQQAKAMAKEAERNAKELEWKLKGTDGVEWKERAVEDRRHAIEAHREALEKQIEEIERQIEKLEADQERVEREADLIQEREESRQEEVEAEERSEDRKDVEEPGRVRKQ